MKVMLASAVALISLAGCASTHQATQSKGIIESTMTSVSNALRINTSSADVEFTQSQKVAVNKEGDQLVVSLKSEPLTIKTPYDNVHLCLSRYDSQALNVSAGTDVRDDMSSCMSQTYLMSADKSSAYLFVGDKMTTSLTAGGPLQATPEGKYQYQVQTLKFYNAQKLEIEDTQNIAVVQERLYGTVWIDKDRDYKLDDGEFTRVVLDINNT